MPSLTEYIWMDGTVPTPELRSKTRVLELPTNPSLKDFPIWSYDGSSTYQSGGGESDLLIHPVRVVPDPIRGIGNYLVMCEVLDSCNEPHPTNTRALLRHVNESGGSNHEPIVGFEQEYTLFAGMRPLGWPEGGYPKPQGPFYCGLGADRVFGREIAEDHTQACIDAGLRIYGINAEVMPGQWEFQIGIRNFDKEPDDVILFCDHLWLSRWLLCRIAEHYNVTVSFANKPIPGDWNGAGCHTNFSTKQIRNPKTGLEAINNAITVLKEKHDEHIALYGHGLEERLTGLHETCPIDQFRAGVADRGASIRIPLQVHQQGYGYFEDRRPGANIDPYLVTARLVTTVCELDESLLQKKTRPTKQIVQRELQTV